MNCCCPLCHPELWREFDKEVELARKKPFVVKESQPIKPEHDFTLQREAWEFSVFQNAAYFSIIAFVDEQRYRSECTSLPEALAAAAPFKRRLVYAVTHTGRSVLLPEHKWERYLKDWEDRNA